MLENMAQPYCGIPTLSNMDGGLNVSAAMRACCKGADFIINGSGCNIYCKLVEQTEKEALQCLSTNMGLKQGNRVGILCSSDAGRLAPISKIAILVAGLLGLGMIQR
jgi:hypothetical protein